MYCVHVVLSLYPSGRLPRCCCCHVFGNGGFFEETNKSVSEPSTGETINNKIDAGVENKKEIVEACQNPHIEGHV